ncbi:xanthine dehydrogenase small subunit [Vreelandella nanhaiensis]|uniref:Xanthine dehydrogenase small subunit n=1 Tax=Vreelandella nanhaiensis TaxID=1258546 RepID=A0A3S0Y442_9GAMM|nr:xanthine dehydrogenase small subunit [Halomonas nanhaiensis]RUR29586.1 xanthine dehydrogenase small subunit [Halomonas nanhaiensis]
MASIEFLFNGAPQQCHASPDTSILTLLREHLGATGTKEGCASGDCGACTVAIGATGSTPKYQSVNACITPAHQLQGKSLVTVEGLAVDGQLHPAQTAMIECHGSQCGFCTPGIVMSLFTLYESLAADTPPLTNQQLEATLGGNLCRCTGYRPIRDAALHMQHHGHTLPNLYHFCSSSYCTESSAQPQVEAESFFKQPTSLADLTKARARFPNARLVAGGTDLWLETTQRLMPLNQLIDVSRVEELLTIEAAELNNQAGWWVGAGVTYTQLEPLLKANFPAFAHLLNRLGSQQIRNRGTLGGNIANASPIGDTPPALLVLDAWVEIANANATRHLSLDNFFVDYKKTALDVDEVLSRIFIPRLPSSHKLHIWKLSKRREDDISVILGAFSYRVEDGRLRDVRMAFGGMAAIPKRALAAEKALENQLITPESFHLAQAALRTDFSPMDDVRGSKSYRQQAAANLIERLYLTLSTPNQEVMLHAYAH